MAFLTREKWQVVCKKLRPYQATAVDFMLHHRRALNFDDMGIGKTFATITAALEDAIDKLSFRMLVCCTVNALYVWKDEFEKWYGITPIMYLGTPAQRRRIFKEKIQYNSEVIVVTTYGMLKELNTLRWNVLTADEIHNPSAGLLNHKNKTFELFMDVGKNTPIVYLLTGTPIRQGVIDLFAPLNLIAFSTFSNYWGFVNKYCITTMTPFGKNIERIPKNIPQFRGMLNNYMIRRLKSEVLHDLPGKQRNPIPLNMTPKQTRAHQGIMEELYYVDQDVTILTPNKMSAILRARQLLVTPRLLGIDDDGAALNYIMETGSSLLVANRPFVIFTPFRQAIPFISDVVQESCSNVNLFKLHGGMAPGVFARAWQGFQQCVSLKKVLICVIKSGASFHATAAADSFFMGYEWDFNLNIQSEDRLCRLGQENFVNCNYLLHENTVDVEVKRKLNDKNDASNWIVGTEEQYQLMLNRFKKGR